MITRTRRRGVGADAVDEHADAHGHGGHALEPA